MVTDLNLSNLEKDLLEATKLVLCDIWRHGNKENNRKTYKELQCDEDGKQILENQQATKFIKNIINELKTVYNRTDEECLEFVRRAAASAGADLRSTRFLYYGNPNPHTLRVDEITDKKVNPKTCIELSLTIKQAFKEAWRDLFK